VIIRPLGRLGELHKRLLEIPHISGARLNDHSIEADMVGTEENCCELLAEIMRDGFRIVEFRQRRADLEQIFMNVTKGDVQ
jgi:hypothetical protein